MLGAVYYKLCAINTGMIPKFTGRMMHGALFSLLNKREPELAEAVHNIKGLKPFTVSELQFNTRTEKGNHYFIKKGERAGWRITALDKYLYLILAKFYPKTIIKIGNVSFIVTEIITDSDRRSDVGIIEEDELVAACLAEDNIKNITFKFISPTVFRTDKIDCIFPDPALIFGSLATKWNRLPTDCSFSLPFVKELAGNAILVKWQGNSQTAYYGRDRGTKAFVGEFTFDVQRLAPEYRQQLLLLAQFAVFSGAGRLTAQGFGRTEIKYE